MSITGDRTEATWLDDSLYPFVSRYVHVDGGRMHYIDEGQGEPIVFVHGFPTWSIMWRGMIRDLSMKHRCIAMDHIGFGLSDKPETWSYVPQAHAQNFRKLLEHVGIGPFSLVVHDFGGPMALSYAVENPHRVKRIVVLNSFMWSLKSDETVQRFSAKVHGPIGKLAMTMTNAGLNRLLRGMIVQRQKVAPKIYGQYSGPFTKASERHGPHALAMSYIDASPWLFDLWTKRESLANKPMQILWGMKDGVLTHAHLDKWRTHWPGADVVTFPECGHLVCEEQAKEAQAALYMFMDGQSELQNVAKATVSGFDD